MFWKTQHPIPNSSLANSFTAHVPLQMLSSRLSPLGAILDLLGQGSHPCSVQASTGFHLGFPEIPLFENSHAELAGRPSVHICPLMNSFPEHKMRLTGKQRSNFSRCLFPHVETAEMRSPVYSECGTMPQKPQLRVIRIICSGLLYWRSLS